MTALVDKPEVEVEIVEPDPMRPKRRHHPLVLTALALGVWYVALQFTDPSEIDSYGLISAIHPLVPLAIVAAIMALGLSVVHNHSSVVLTTHVSAIILMLFGPGAVVGNSIQARIVLRHEGIADQIFQAGSIDPTIDAYFSWPGFFTAAAYARSVGEIESFATSGIWSPVFINLIMLAPLLTIFRQATSDRRVVWSAVMFFYLGNWIGQDYFAPQAISFTIHLSIVAILLRFFRTEASPEDAAMRVRYLLVAIVAYVAIVPSHQLTPALTTMSVGALVIVRQCTVRRLPILFGSIFIAWMVFMTTNYLEGNLSRMIELFGDLSEATGANVTERVAGSSEHQTVVLLRLLYTPLYFVLAGIGWLRARHHDGRIDWAMTSLAVAPASLVIMQPYGGEMVLRVFLFTLPFTSFYAAHAIRSHWRLRWDRPDGHTKQNIARVAVVLGTCFMVVLFFYARYGNSVLDQFGNDERSVVNALYEDAEPGALLLVAVDNVAWKHQGYDSYDHQSLDRLVDTAIDASFFADAATALMYQHRDVGAYFIASRTQQSYIELLGGLPPETLPAIESQLLADPNIELISGSDQIRVYRLSPQEST